MKNLILFACVISFFVFGCKKEDPEIKTKLLTKITTTGRNISIKLLNYDISNNLISIEYIDVKTGTPLKTFQYTYKDGKLFTMDIYNKTFFYELSYSTDSVYLTRKYSSITNEYVDYIFYYNNNGVIDSVNMFTYNTQYRFILDGNNNVMGYSHYEPIMNYIYNFKYDDMKNAYSSLPIEYRILNYINTGLNNVTYYETPSENISLSYEYDAESYPAKCIINYRPRNNGSTYSEYDTLKFEYK